MVLYCLKWNIHPDKVDAYMAWAKSAIQRTVAAGGVTEFRAYRPASGAFQVVHTQDRGEAVMYLGEQDADPSVERAERLLRRHLADAAPETRSDRSAGSPEAADRTPVLLYLLAGYGSGTLN